MALKKFAFTDINGVIGGGGSGIYDDKQPPDGSTMKERIKKLKLKYPAHTFHEEKAIDDVQPSGDVFHVKNGKLTKWTKAEIEIRRKKKRKDEIEDEMIRTQAEIDACDKIIGIDMSSKKAEKQEILAKQKQEHNAVSFDKGLSHA